jgi:hypothetical protein
MNRPLRIIVPSSTASTPAVDGCVLCSRPVAASEQLCGRCRKDFDPTALDSVLDAIGMPEREFADLTGVSFRSVLRAAKGVKMSARIARRLAELTGLRAETFRENARYA